ncbi:Cytochrome c oxidase subunit 2 [archaeon HR01]|nr:Cytochrome c oxidase subunit 2 [archaeon HR01]
MERAKLVERVTIIGAILLFAYIGYTSYAVLQEIENPQQPYDLLVKVNARQFAWEFVYPDGSVSPELRVKAGQTVRLELHSGDVIHSLFIRDFQLKKDVVPGRTNVVYLTPLVPGRYVIQCAEFCGRGHYSMVTYLVVE